MTLEDAGIPIRTKHEIPAEGVNVESSVFHTNLREKIVFSSKLGGFNTADIVHLPYLTRAVCYD
jgi:hypothetical protein